MSHPARFSQPVLDALTLIIMEHGVHVHDPFAGTGERLGQLCDSIGVSFSGTEIEPEFIADPRVWPGDSTDPATYPDAQTWIVVTSPVYPNGMTDHFKAKDASKRHTYRQGLAEITGEDRPLHPNNMGRYGNAHRRSRRSQDTHFEIARRCIEWWPDVAVINVKDVSATNYFVPVGRMWADLMVERGWRLASEQHIHCPGQRYGANGDQRADCEYVLVFNRDKENK